MPNTTRLEHWPIVLTGAIKAHAVTVNPAHIGTKSRSADTPPINMMMTNTGIVRRSAISVKADCFPDCGSRSLLQECGSEESVGIRSPIPGQFRMQFPLYA